MYKFDYIYDEVGISGHQTALCDSTAVFRVYLCSLKLFVLRLYWHGADSYSIGDQNEMRKRITALRRIRKWADTVRGKITLLYRSYKDPRTPWYAKAAIGIALGYALSPIDLIPDFIPILGYLDDLILLPLLFMLAFKLIPHVVLTDAETAIAEQTKAGTSGRHEKESSTEFIHRIWIPILLIVIFWIGMIVIILRSCILR